ncbi:MULTISPECIES: AraC family transcriptional regulator [Pseudomonas]|uniref:AraC family transcriptional regulator n=1 Tax=Pseudomonas neustonica TaxID=2487346 RepID=A0ABX9XIB7_9PSED|nr:MULTISPECIES: AraC family transcriptional regulator [Pseudomonas]MBA6420705.1 AraC family transcriptional regulator [Pseudomonas sp. 5Ae-yellow]ROZ81511.1 AraC family transcriptional regulator [Pseudomonas sp. SSM44]ROZ82965.1 AraC family transcriptional regulator [Pseudomonas neustonica]|tara:strand:- start:2073 stop:3104 length:1032 start_codon:yes stop_codon:yes gene_type:complete
MQTLSWPAHSRITSVQLLAQFGTDNGLSLDQCLQGTGLSVLALANPQQEANASQELQLIANLLEGLSDQPALGLAAGQRYRLSHYGIWGYALLSSGSLREALDLGLRYLDLTFAFSRIELHVEADRAFLQLDAQVLPKALHDFVLLRDCAAIALIQRELTGQESPFAAVELCLPIPEAQERVLYCEALGCEPRFARPHNRIELDQRLLDLPLAGANAATAQLCEAQCRQLLQSYRSRGGLAAQVRELLLSRPGRVLDMPQLAARLNIGERTLRRRLAAEQVSFRQLLDESRQALAEELLAVEGMPLEAIAQRLGYGELSNFIHAFKRWKGMPPRRYRQQRSVG